MLKYCAIEVEDEYGETIKVRVSRWKYPAVAADIDALKMDKDVIVVEGYTSDFGGLSIQAKQLAVLEV